MPNLRMKNSKEEYDETFGDLWVPFTGMKIFLVMFETDAEVVKELLPPPLEYAGEPGQPATVMAYVFDTPRGGVQLPIIAAPRGHKELAYFIGPAKYRDLIGVYNPLMYVGTDDHMMHGREEHGCPKKITDIVLDRHKDELFSSCERNGIKFFDMTGKLSGKPSDFPIPEAIDVFTLKFVPAAEGREGKKGGFDFAHILHIIVKFKVNDTPMEVVDGKIEYRESPYDPIDDIPFSKAIVGLYSEDTDILFHGNKLVECDHEAIKEFALFRYR